MHTLRKTSRFLILSALLLVPLAAATPVRADVPQQPGVWGQPQQPQQPGWGQPQQPQQPGWGQPQQPQQPGWGQPQQPQQPGWGQPQQPQQPGWGQPQQPGVAAPGPLEGRWVWVHSTPARSMGFVFSGNRFSSWTTGMPGVTGTYALSGARLIMQHETGPDAGKTDNLACEVRGNQLFIGVSPGQPPIVFTRQ